jgi:Holliday junction resolvasome RuvABC endonuclease subunit
MDLASTTGWAFSPLPAVPLTQLEAVTQKPPQPRSGVHRIAEPGTGVGAFLSAYRAWLIGMLREHEPAGLIFEAPILPRGTNIATVRKLTGLSGVTQMVAHDRRIGWVREAQPSQIKLHICGDGSKGKGGVMRAIAERGWTFETDDEADALALLDLAGHIYYRERMLRGMAA